MHTDPADDAIDGFLVGAPRADVWRDLRETLQRRRDSLRAERDSLPEGDPRRATLARKVAETDTQIDALAREEAVTRFVEDTVRATLALPRPDDPDPDDDF